MMSTIKELMLLIKKQDEGIGCRITCTLLTLFGAILMGCSDKEPSVSSQVAAKVNNGEITVHQVNSRLARSALGAKSDTAQLSKRILESLIDQELLVQQAIDVKMDRDPIVMQAMEEAKRKVLSQAYLERLVYSRTAPTAQEINAYYVQHPELFSKRKIYKWHTFLVSREKFNTALKSSLDKVRSGSEVAGILKSQSIDFTEETAEWPAEQMPMELLQTTLQMNTGDIVPFGRDNEMALMLLEGAVERPVDEAQAQPAIQKYLLNSKNEELLENKLKQLRASAQISYLGQFAERLPGFAESASVDKETTTAAKQQTDEYMHKGLSGLKK
jgi:EpsD family peptidyl-prolyl cis-trans isomerase